MTDVASWQRARWVRVLIPVAITLVTSVALYVLEIWSRANTPLEALADGYRFQPWSSNWMMQNLGIEDMASFGPMSLLLKHVYPPGLDAIRYILMLPETNAGLPTDQTAVDMRLYIVYCLFFGVTNALAYVWVKDLTRSVWWGLGGAALWALAPGHLLAATLLEPTELSLLTIGFCYYFLYRFLKTRRAPYVTAFLLALLIGSLARSFLQSYILAILVVVIICFWFMAKERARTWGWQALNILLLLLIFAWPVKQFVLYGTTSPSTFSGYHRVGMLNVDPTTVPPLDTPQKYVDNALKFSSRYNTQETLKDNYRLEHAADNFIRQHPIDAAKGLAQSLTVTIPEMLRPTTMYTYNTMVEPLFWKAPFNWVFSGWRALLLVVISMAAIAFTRGRRGTVALIKRYWWFVGFYMLIAIPVVWSNRYRPGEEFNGAIWTDAVRLKLFIELPASILVIYALYAVVTRLRSRRASHTSVGTLTESAIGTSGSM